MVNIEKLEKTLNILKSLGIEECGFVKQSDGSMNIAGIDKLRSSVVFQTIEGLFENDVGILNVQSLLSRIQLFDKSKLKLETSGEEYVNEIILKESRKKSKVTTTHPKELIIPTQLPEIEPLCSVTMPHEFVQYFSSMVSSINAAPGSEDTVMRVTKVTGEGEESAINISVKNEYDSFSEEWDVMDFSLTGYESFDMVFPVANIVKALKTAVKYSETDKVTVTFCSPEYGIAVIDLGLIDVLVSATTSTATNNY